MNQLKKIAFVIEYNALKGYYPFERACMLAANLKEQASIFLFVKDANHASIELFTQHNLTPIQFENYKQLLPTIRNLQLDLILFDGEDSTIELVKQLNNFCSTIIHFDDFGLGAKSSLFHFKALYDEEIDVDTSNEIIGNYFFVTTPTLKHIKQHRLIRERAIDEVNTPPHVVIYFEDGDYHNLSYRTFRHLSQLHIPLKISIILDDQYSHATDDLSLMALQRKNVQLIRTKNAIESALIDADCLICNNLYTPFKAAYINIPTITVAQHERELSFAFGRTANCFIHIGLGRKMKQSHLQNALMEYLLHDSIRKRAIDAQQSFTFDYNEGLLAELLIEIAHQRYNISALLK